MNSDNSLDEALNAMTDVLMRGSGEAGMHRVARAYDQSAVEPFVPLLLTLRDAYAPVEPSQKFLRQLHEDLIGEPQRGLLGRARSMPPRVQFAAGAVAVLGFGLIAVRWLVGLFSSREEDDAEVAPHPKTTGGA